MFFDCHGGHITNLNHGMIGGARMKTKWKIFLTAGLIGALTVSMTACGGSSTPDQGDASVTQEGQTENKTDAGAVAEGTVYEMKSPEYAYAVSFTAPADSGLAIENVVGYNLEPNLTVTPDDMNGYITLSRAIRNKDTFASNKESALEDGGQELKIGDYEGYVQEGWGDGYLVIGPDGDTSDLIVLYIERCTGTEAPDTIEFLNNADVQALLSTMQYDGDIPDKIVYDGVPDWTRVLVVKNLDEIYTAPEGGTAEMTERNGNIYAELKYGDVLGSAEIHPIYSTSITAEEQAAKEHESFPDREFENMTIGGLDCMIWHKDNRWWGYAEKDGVALVLDFRSVDDPEVEKMIQAMFDNMTVDAERWHALYDN